MTKTFPSYKNLFEIRTILENWKLESNSNFRKYRFLIEFKILEIIVI